MPLSLEWGCGRGLDWGNGLGSIKSNTQNKTFKKKKKKKKLC